MELNARSLANLEGVHADLVAVVQRAAEITPIDFVITEGVRTLERQKLLVAKGASRTMKSRHLLAGAEHVSHAVDLAAVIEGTVQWHWPLYTQLADAMKTAADELGVPIEWGGDWRTFKDGPHFQLPHEDYPA
jgi:peptidoglycan LD-endopeptidase CwlK